MTGASGAGEGGSLQSLPPMFEDFAEKTVQAIKRAEELAHRLRSSIGKSFLDKDSEMCSRFQARCTPRCKPKTVIVCTCSLRLAACKSRRMHRRR